MCRDFVEVLEPADFVRRSETGGVDIVDNFGMYQTEVEIMLNGSPFMDTFCVLMKDGEHLGCNVEELAGRNAGGMGMWVVRGGCCGDVDGRLALRRACT